MPQLPHLRRDEPGTAEAGALQDLYLSHPDSVYFNVGKIGADQLEDQARRRGADIAQLQRLLAPNL